MLEDLFPFLCQYIVSRDLPFNLIIRTPACNNVNNTTIGVSISIRLVTNTVDTPPRNPRRHVDWPTIEDFDSLSTHLDRRFVLSDAGFRCSASHPALTSSGLALNRPIRTRICRKSTLDTMTSAIWNTTYLECLTTLAPILISFSRSVLSDHFFTGSGNTNRLRKLPRL